MFTSYENGLFSGLDSKLILGIFTKIPNFKSNFQQNTHCLLNITRVPNF